MLLLPVGLRIAYACHVWRRFSISQFWHTSGVLRRSSNLKLLPQRSSTVWGRWIRLIVGFQPLMVISLTASWIRWCMQVYACELMWTCLVRAERSTSDGFWVPSHQFNSATGEQKWITQTIYTDSEPPSRLPNSLMPSWEAQTWHDTVGLTRSGWRDAVGLHPEWTL